MYIYTVIYMDTHTALVGRSGCGKSTVKLCVCMHLGIYNIFVHTIYMHIYNMYIYMDIHTCCMPFGIYNIFVHRIYIYIYKYICIYI